MKALKRNDQGIAPRVKPLGGEKEPVIDLWSTELKPLQLKWEPEMPINKGV